MDIVKYGESLVPESMRADWDMLVKAHRSVLKYKEPEAIKTAKVLIAHENILSSAVGVVAGVAALVLSFDMFSEFMNGNPEFSGNEITFFAALAAELIFCTNSILLNPEIKSPSGYKESLLHRTARWCRSAVGLKGEFAKSGLTYQKELLEYNLAQTKHKENLLKQSKKVKSALTRLNKMDSRYSFDFNENGLVCHEILEKNSVSMQLESLIVEREKV